MERKAGRRRRQGLPLAVSPEEGYKAGRRRQRRWWVVEVVSVEFFSDKVPMDLRRRRINKRKERKNI